MDAAATAVGTEDWATAERKIAQAEIYLATMELEKGDQSSNTRWRETLEKTRKLILDHKANTQADSDNRRFIRGRINFS